MKLIGMLGACFNPPTLGHKDVIEQAMQKFDEILLVPSLSHPFGKSLAPSQHRLEMMRIFISQWKSQNLTTKITIFNVEAMLKVAGFKDPIYSYDVLDAVENIYKNQLDDFKLEFIVGPDNAASEVWQRFYKHDEILRRWDLFVVKEQVPIRSSAVRELVAKSFLHDPKLYAELIKMVPPQIADYIIKFHLYQLAENADANDLI